MSNNTYDQQEHKRLTKRDQFLLAMQQSSVVMGILNVTPDSFSDGGQFNDLPRAMAQAEKMCTAGAAIIDVGAESTRPGHTLLTLAEEWQRLEPLISTLCQALPIAVSVDTYKAEIALRCASQGAAVINDIWGLQGDPDMAKIVYETQSAVVIMHNRDTIDDTLDIISDIQQFFDRSLDIAHQANIKPEHIILDPGIGFGKSMGQNYHVLQRLDELTLLGYPVLLGLSRKRIIADALNDPLADRTAATLIANMIGLQKGARIVRVHNVAEHVQAIQVLQAIKDKK